MAHCPKCGTENPKTARDEFFENIFSMAFWLIVLGAIFLYEAVRGWIF